MEPPSDLDNSSILTASKNRADAEAIASLDMSASVFFASRESMDSGQRTAGTVLLPVQSMGRRWREAPDEGSSAE